ncbi:MAG: glycosyltransferase family 2 protein [Candidatus Cloacimonadaceae bacterium]
MHKLSVSIITKNEEHNIRRCLESVIWADEIVVVDSGSVDKTKEICREYECKIIESEWLGFGKTKQLAVQNTSYNWVLSVDADEVITPELKSEITELLKSEPRHYGYRIKRSSFYLGRQIRYCGWNRDYTVGVFNKNFGAFNDRTVHEFVEIKGEIGLLNGIMLHYTYPTLNLHFDKMRRYSEMGAQNLYQKGRSSSPCAAILRGCLKFLKMYLLQLGCLDGKLGFLLSYNSAWGIYQKYILLWEKNKSKSST